MIPAFALLTVLLDSEVVVPRAHWRAIDVKVPEAGTVVKMTFSTQESGSRVQAWFMTRDHAERFARGGSLRPLAMTDYDDRGGFHHVVENAGSYILLIDNRLEGRRATPVHVTVELLPPAASVRTVPPERRRVVELSSVLFLLAVVAYSARQLMK